MRPLAAGGMAELYLAARVLQEGTPPSGAPTLAAVKRLLPHLGWDPEFVRMFLDEVRIAASLRHPNIVRVLDFGVGEGGHYLAMEYLHGRTLRAVMRSIRPHGPLPLAFAVGTIMEIAAGLHAAHEHRDDDGHPLEVVHRDVSPSNAIVGFDGSVKLLDFGIARVSEQTQLTRAGTIKGKVGYMSPEQCRGDRVDRRTDVFGLGILLYELTVGRRAFYADNDYAVIGRVVDGDYEPPRSLVPDYPAPLAEVVARALAVEPDGRYPTAAALSDELARFARDQGLDVGAPQRADVLAERFGVEPVPTIDRRALLRSLAPASPPSRPLRWAIPLALGGAVGVAGFVAGGLRGATPDAKATEAVVPAASESEGSSPVEDRPVAPGPDAQRPPVLVDAEQVPEVEPTPEPRPKRSKATSRRRSKPRKKKRAATPPADPDELLPSSWKKDG